jgi:peptide/nickel transport system permease protein
MGCLCGREIDVGGIRLEPTLRAGMHKPAAVDRTGGAPTRGEAIKHTIIHNKVAFAASLFLVFIVLIAILAPLISPETYGGYDRTQGSLHPHIGWRYLLGTDVFGHSMVAYLILGARTTVGIGVLATAIALALGCLGGIVAGVVGGWLDRVVMTIVDIVLTVPFLVLVFILVAYEGGNDPWSIAVLLGLVGAFCATQLLRHACVQEMRKPSVSAAKAAGASKTRVLRRHVLPALLAPCVYAATLLLCALISAEATMDFLGFGVLPETVSWGTVLSLAPAYITGGLWWWYILPGLALVATLLSIALVGNAVTAALEQPGRQPFSLGRSAIKKAERGGPASDISASG